MKDTQPSLERFQHALETPVLYMTLSKLAGVDRG